MSRREVVLALALVIVVGLLAWKVLSPSNAVAQPPKVATVKPVKKPHWTRVVQTVALSSDFTCGHVTCTIVSVPVPSNPAQMDFMWQNEKGVWLNSDEFPLRIGKPGATGQIVVAWSPGKLSLIFLRQPGDNVFGTAPPHPVSVQFEAVYKKVG